MTRVMQTGLLRAAEQFLRREHLDAMADAVDWALGELDVDERKGQTDVG